MKPIFLYLKSCKLSDRQLKKLHEAGYVTLPVDSFESVKIAEPIFMGSNPIANAGYQAILDSLSSTTKADFGVGVAKAILSK